MAEHTFAKLKSGQWGVRIRSPRKPEPGDVYTITKRNGDTTDAEIADVVWSGDHDGKPEHLCAIVGKGRKATGNGSGSGAYCPHCGGRL